LTARITATACFAHRQHCDQDALAARLQHRLDNTEELAILPA